MVPSVARSAVVTGKKRAPRLPRPAVRYWKGRAPKCVAGQSNEDEDSDSDQNVFGEYEVRYTQLVHVKEKSLNVSLPKTFSVSENRKIIVAGREGSGRSAFENGQADVEDESDEETEESSEYETDSSENAEQPKQQLRPMFIPKRARATIAERNVIALESKEAEERCKQSHDMVVESIKLELAEVGDLVSDVNDTDGLDHDGEFEAWKLRELLRIKKEKEEEIRREKEREEIEQRRAMPEEQRLKEDLEMAQNLREKPKGQQIFLQKYRHKGAFHQDEDILKTRDYTEATESTIDVSLLPKVMQVKNFGKRSRTKYTHLLDQDTSIEAGRGYDSNSPRKRAHYYEPEIRY